ncbi:hypothetical protein VDG1235_723 [Verrucomicrobiia bacterium DG1235]|nr:hypothetical protein VDG1235_723 [Verrucomicrobiae bacterium DG1235]
MIVPSKKLPPERKAPEPSRKRRERKPRVYSREQWVIGIGGTILAHIWIFFLISIGLLEIKYEDLEDPYKEFSIELAGLDAEEEEQFYTQTNPDVPENEPDETNRYGARSQQAANEEEPEELDPENRPATESDDNIETDQFLSGSLEEPVLAPPPTATQEPQESAQPQEPAQNQPMLQAVAPSEEFQRREIPLAGELDEADLEEEGIAEHNYEPSDEAPTNILDLIEGEEEEGEEEPAAQASPELMASVSPLNQEANPAEDGVPSPRARPQLPRLPAGPVRDSRLGVSSIGQLSVDAKASKFGEYMERLIETVKLNWDDLVQRSSSVERKSVVKIRFMLNKDGIVTDIEILEGTTAKVFGIHMCRLAIERGVPFGPWPEGLVDMFGDEEDVTFNFHYY